MSRTTPLHAALALAALAFASAGSANIVTCESVGGDTRSCPVDTSGGVVLSRQLSRAGCWEGDTWGYDRNRIWVSGGCRAEFNVGQPRSASRGRNNDAKVAGALVLGAVAAAVIANNRRQESSSPQPGYDYGYGGGRRTFTCESIDGRLKWCNEFRGRNEDVEISRQLSRSPCSFGDGWGVDNAQGEVWVANGCRAEFTVY